MAIRPFKLCTTAELDAAKAHATSTLDAWVDHWLGSALRSDFSVACKAMRLDQLDVELTDGSWFHCSGENGDVWASGRQVQAVASLLFGRGNHSDTNAAARIGQRALTMLLLDLASCQTSSAESTLAAIHSPPRQLAEPGRLSMVLTIASPDVSFTVLLERTSSGVVQPSSDRKLPTGSIKPGVGRQKVMVSACLGEAVIDLGSLRGLSVGDVLMLDQRHSGGIDLKVGSERLPCVGHLGALDGRIAVEVSRQ